jgi:hypothetical protein
MPELAAAEYLPLRISLFLLPLDAITSLLTPMLRQTDYSRSLATNDSRAQRSSKTLANETSSNNQGDPFHYILNGIIHLFDLYSIANADFWRFTPFSVTQQIIANSTS